MECLNCGCFECCCRTRLPNCRCPDRAYPSLEGGHRDIRVCSGNLEEIKSHKLLHPSFKCSYCGEEYSAQTSDGKCSTLICNRCDCKW